MSKKTVFCVFCAFLWLFPLPAQAEIIDRIVAVVEGRIITLSDVRQEREIRTRLGEKPIGEDRVLVRQMIDDYLIENQIGDVPGTDVTEDEVDADLARFRTQGETPSQVMRNAVRRRIRMAKHFEVRFRQSIRASDEEVKKYYDQTFVPEAKAQGLNPIPSLEQVTDGIRKNIIEESLNHEVKIWLEAIRRRSRIEVFE